MTENNENKILCGHLENETPCLRPAIFMGLCEIHMPNEQKRAYIPNYKPGHEIITLSNQLRDVMSRLIETMQLLKTNTMSTDQALSMARLAESVFKGAQAILATKEYKRQTNNRILSGNNGGFSQLHKIAMPTIQKLEEISKEA